MTQRFSYRHGYARTKPQTLIREDAPNSLREAICAMSEDYNPGHVSLLNRIYLLTGQHPRDKPRVGNDMAAALVRGFLNKCEWFHVYDTIEIIHELLQESGFWGPTIRFEEEVNEYFVVTGIGYQLVDGKIEHRGDEDFEDTFASAVSLTAEAGLPRAQSEIREARRALSRRPDPDLSGAITHAMNAWLSVARAIIGDDNADPREILRRKPDLAPKPLDQVITGTWGYSSQYGRKASETKSPTYSQAELVVHVSAAATAYIVREFGLIDGAQPHDQPNPF